MVANYQSTLSQRFNSGQFAQNTTPHMPAHPTPPISAPTRRVGRRPPTACPGCIPEEISMDKKAFESSHLQERCKPDLHTAQLGRRCSTRGRPGGGSLCTP